MLFSLRVTMSHGLGLQARAGRERYEQEVLAKLVYAYAAGKIMRPPDNSGD